MPAQSAPVHQRAEPQGLCADRQRRARPVCSDGGRPVPRQHGVHGAAGRGQQELEGLRAGFAGHAGVRHDPQGSAGGRGRRRCGGSGRILRRHLHAGHRVCPVPHHHAVPGGFLHRRQDRGGSGRDQEHRGGFLAALCGAHRPRHAGHAAPPPVRERSGGGPQGGHHCRPGAVRAV